MSDASPVFVYAFLTALATGLGAIPFFFVRTISERFVAYSEAVAAGLMLGASFGLVAEGTAYGSGETLLGGLLGVLARWLAGVAGRARFLRIFWRFLVRF